MSRDLILALVSAVWLIIGCVCGFFMGKGMYDQPIEESVTRDTVCVTDTVPHYYPKPVEVIKTKTDYRWLTRVENTTDTLHDSVLVEVPITSKHYGGDQYDAWVSGYEPSLDSIKVYQRTEYITETVTKSKPPNKWELDIIGGIDYNIKQQRYTPHAGGELLYKPNRLQVGLRGGVIKADKVEPYVGGVVKIKIL